MNKNLTECHKVQNSPENTQVYQKTIKIHQKATKSTRIASTFLKKPNVTKNQQLGQNQQFKMEVEAKPKTPNQGKNKIVI